MSVEIWEVIVPGVKHGPRGGRQVIPITAELFVRLPRAVKHAVTSGLQTPSPRYQAWRRFEGARDTCRADHTTATFVFAAWFEIAMKPSALAATSRAANIVVSAFTANPCCAMNICTRCKAWWRAFGTRKSAGADRTCATRAGSARSAFAATPSTLPATSGATDVVVTAVTSNTCFTTRVRRRCKAWWRARSARTTAGADPTRATRISATGFFIAVCPPTLAACCSATNIGVSALTTNAEPTV
mmetsp:Transcript_42790/g.118195  ORF Transcript_42790/g.118195 Transcript_42790/m.118195 type:complete len:243 (-) Transcript_42790:121-849(-)